MRSNRPSAAAAARKSHAREFHALPVFGRAHGVRERAICKPAREQHPSSTQAASTQQHASTTAAPSSAHAAPNQHR
eukprot:2283804-Lingulodinium_polyedra.AAC.1